MEPQALLSEALPSSGEGRMCPQTRTFGKPDESLASLKKRNLVSVPTDASLVGTNTEHRQLYSRCQLLFLCDHFKQQLQNKIFAVFADRIGEDIKENVMLAFMVAVLGAV